MRFIAKAMVQCLTIFIVGNTLTLNNAVANDKSTSLPSTPEKLSTEQSTRQRIDLLSKNLSEMKTSFVALDNRVSRVQDTAELNNKIEKLQSSLEDNKNRRFDTTSILLNICIAVTAVFVTVIGVVFAILAYFGFSNIRALKPEVISETKNIVDSMYKDKIDEIFRTEASKIRTEMNDNLSELTSKIEGLQTQLTDRLGGMTSAEAQPSVTRTASANLFDDK